MSGYIETDLLIESEGRRLVATACLPEDETGGFRCGVITLHGWGGTRCGPHRMFVRLGRKLAKAGIPAIRFDLPGRGYSDGEDVSLDMMIRDTLSVAEFFRQQYAIENIRLCGICSGGNVAIGAATLAGFDKITMVSTFPFTPPAASATRRTLIKRLKQYAKKAMSFNTWLRLFRGQVSVRGVGKVLQDSVQEAKSLRNLKDSSRDIMQAFAGFKGDAYFVYGSADPQAPEAEAHYREFCGCNRIDAEFSVIDGANHNFMASHLSEELEQKLSIFLQS